MAHFPSTHHRTVSTATNGNVRVVQVTTYAEIPPEHLTDVDGLASIFATFPFSSSFGGGGAAHPPIPPNRVSSLLPAPDADRVPPLLPAPNAKRVPPLLPAPNVENPKNVKFDKSTNAQRRPGRKRPLLLNSGAKADEQQQQQQNSQPSASSRKPLAQAPKAAGAHTLFGRRPLESATQPLYHTIWAQWKQHFPTEASLPGPAASQQPLIHPYLNADAQRRAEFFFDLAMPTSTPMRQSRSVSGRIVPVLLGSAELEELATYPSVTKLHIVCDLIPKKWHVDLGRDYNSSSFPSSSAPPITLGQVLAAVHSGLHRSVTSVDRAMLNQEQEYKVNNAYQLRCKNSGALESVQRAGGMKRVDYLMGKTQFEGLKWVGEGSVMLVVS